MNKEKVKMIKEVEEISWIATKDIKKGDTGVIKFK